MYYILNCRFDIHDTYWYQNEIEKETEKSYITKNNERISKKKMNQVIVHSYRGLSWCEIYVATYSKPEDVQAGIEKIKRLRVEYLNRLANQKMEIERGD